MLFIISYFQNDRENINRMILVDTVMVSVLYINYYVHSTHYIHNNITKCLRIIN